MEAMKGWVARFDTLEELTAAHIVLLKRELESGPDGGGEKLLGDVMKFLKKGQATGNLLDDDQDRRATQSLLNYWVTVLYRAGVDPPYAILAPYDPRQAEKDLSATRCPYVGLNAFRAEDREYFFGREKITKAVVGNLASKPLLVIVGPSGSGKSSLLHAGILPALEDGTLLPASKGWRRYPAIMPGRAPLTSLKLMLQSIAAEGETDGPPEVEVFKKSGTTLLEYLDRPGVPPALICVDQFEEVFTVCKYDDEREAFLNNLLGVVKSQGVRHKLVLTMRSDRAGYVLRRSELNESFHEAEVRLPPLTEEEMRSAVDGPARRVGLVVKAGVVEQLVKEIYGDPSGLPLLQFTLLKLWEQKERGSITLASLRRRGDCREALANSADEFYGGLEERVEKEVARRVLLKMVRLSEGLEMTSNRVRRGELHEAIKNPRQIDEVLRRLDAAHLVRITRPGPPAQGTDAAAVEGRVGGEPSADDQFELAHESLMYTWPKLEDWLKQDREAMILQQHLESYVAEWVLSGRGQDALLDKYKLYEANRWLTKHDPSESSHGDDLLELVRVSQSAINWAKAIRRALTAALLVTLVAAVLVAWQAMSESRRAFSRQLAAQALINKSEHLDLALLLSLEANRIERNEDLSSVSVTSLLQTLNHSPKLIAFLHPLGYDAPGVFSPGVKSVSFDSAGSKMASYDELGKVIIWDVEGRKELRRLNAKLEGEKLEGELVSTAFSADGGLLALRYRDNTVILWDVNSGERLRSLDISPPGKEAGGRVQRGGDPGPPESRLVNTIIYPEGRDYFEVRDKPAERDSGITFSMDGQTLIANYPDEAKTIIPWDIGGLGVKESPVLAGQSAGQRRQLDTGRSVLAQALSPGLTRLAVVRKESSRDHATAEVRTAEGANRAVISLPGVLKKVVRVDSLAFSPDEKMLACLYRDGDEVHTLVLWNIEGERSDLLFTSPIRPRNNSVEPLIAFAPDGRLAIASSVGNVTLLDNTREVNPEGLALLPTGSMGVINSIAFGFGGQRLAAGYQDGTILLWDYALPRERIGAVTPHQNEQGTRQSVYGLIFDVDGGRLVSASIGGDSVAVSRIVSGYSEDKQSTTTFSLESATDISFSPDGKVAALNYGDRVVLRDASGGTGRGEFKEEGKNITAVALSRGGKRLAAGYDDGSATVWEVGSRRKLADIPHGRGDSPIDEVAGIALNAEGTQCAVGSSSGALRLWDVGKGDGVQLTIATGETWSMRLVFTPDGKQLISFDDRGETTFRDISGKPMDRPLINVPGLYVESVTFSPDGKLMVTASRAGEGILWDMETHKQLGKLFLDKGGDDVSAVAYRAGGNLLAVGYSSGEIILFDISTRKFREIACQIANRRLSDDERRYYQLRKGDWRHLGLGDWSSYFGGGQVSPTCPVLP
ncbi:MAG: hypothetical protein H7Z38_08435 [Rubrivivax sp.]|nr:hypothetical protein [Pyrinomonadaceae bacterium]